MREQNKITEWQVLCRVERVSSTLLVVIPCQECLIEEVVQVLEQAVKKAEESDR